MSTKVGATRWIVTPLFLTSVLCEALMARLGIGHLRAAFLRGERRRLGLLEVSGHYLLSELMPQARPESFRSELQGVVAVLRRSQDDRVKPDVAPIAA